MCGPCLVVVNYHRIERISVRAPAGELESHSQEKVLKVRSEYEKKLNSMQAELKKVQAAKREHAKLLKNQTHYEKQLKTLQKDLGELRKIKVRVSRAGRAGEGRSISF